MALSAKVQDGLERATNRLREWVGHRIDDQALDLARLYRASRETLGGRLRMIYENFLGDEPTLVKARMSPASAALGQAIDTTINDLTLAVGTQATEALQLLNGMSASAVNKFLTPWTGLPVAELPVSSAWVLQELSTTLTGGGSAFDRFFSVGEELKAKVASDVRRSLLSGESFEDLRARVQTSFGVDTLDEPKFNAYGSVKVYKNEARRQWSLLMGEHAESVGAMEIWWAELDDATTPGCLARHGRPINELGERPPRHFNCRCEPMIAPPETGPEQFDAWRADADEWLHQKGFSRRQAAQMEAVREAWDPAEHPRGDAGKFADAGGDKGGVVTPSAAEVPAQVHEWVASLGARVNGIQRHVIPGHPGFLVLTDKETGSSIFLKMDQVSKTAIQARLEQMRAKFAVAQGKESAAPWWGPYRLALAQEGAVPEPAPVFDDAGEPVEVAPRFRYQALPWRSLPLVLAQGLSPADSAPSALEAARRADPESVMLRLPAQAGRVGPQRIEVLAEERWIPVQLPGATYVEVQPRLFVADAPVPVAWTPTVVRPSLDATTRFPGLARLVLQDRGTGWAGALVSQDQALPWVYATTTDLEPPMPARETARTLPALLDALLAQLVPPDPYLVLWDKEGLRCVFALTSGQALYAREDFRAPATYERVAVYCPEGGTVWAVRPRGHPYWVLPGGHVDPGESKAVAAIREMAEETGVPVALTGYLGRLSRPWATTHVFLGRPSGPVGTPTTLDEIDAVAAIELEDLDPSERLWLQARSPMVEAKAFDPVEHPRGEGGMFAFKGAGIQPSPMSVTPTKGPHVYTDNSSQRPQREKMTKLQVGRLGEDLAVDWLQKRGIAAERLEVEGRNNFPVDLLAWDKDGPVLYEVKAGRVSNKRGSQQWRVTLGKPGPKVAAWLKTAPPAAKRRFNALRVTRALRRKEEERLKAEKILGRKVRLKTLAFVIDTDKRTADVHAFDGAHRRIGWTSEQARDGYTGTVKYQPRKQKEAT